MLRSVYRGRRTEPTPRSHPSNTRGLPVFDQSITLRPLTPGPGTQSAQAFSWRSARMSVARAVSCPSGRRCRRWPMVRRTRRARQQRPGGQPGRFLTDLSSSRLRLGYLLGHGKLDGKFHAISVRVTRPGIRRACEARLPRDVGERAAGEHWNIDPGTARLDAVIAPLADYARELPLRVHAATGWRAGEAAVPTVWVRGSSAAAGSSRRSGRPMPLPLSNCCPRRAACLAPPGSISRRRLRPFGPR